MLSKGAKFMIYNYFMVLFVFLGWFVACHSTQNDSEAYQDRDTDFNGIDLLDELNLPKCREIDHEIPGESSYFMERSENFPENCPLTPHRILCPPGTSAKPEKNIEQCVIGWSCKIDPENCIDKNTELNSEVLHGDQYQYGAPIRNACDNGMEICFGSDIKFNRCDYEVDWCDFQFYADMSRYEESKLINYESKVNFSDCIYIVQNLDENDYDYKLNQSMCYDDDILSSIETCKGSALAIRDQYGYQGCEVSFEERTYAYEICLVKIFKNLDPEKKCKLEGGNRFYKFCNICNDCYDYVIDVFEECLISFNKESYIFEKNCENNFNLNKNLCFQLFDNEKKLNECLSDNVKEWNQCIEGADWSPCENFETTDESCPAGYESIREFSEETTKCQCGLPSYNTGDYGLYYKYGYSCDTRFYYQVIKINEMNEYYQVSCHPWPERCDVSSTCRCLAWYDPDIACYQTEDRQLIVVDFEHNF
jgi:hypothetical protein